jgi:hypothetical protein
MADKKSPAAEAAGIRISLVQNRRTGSTTDTNKLKIAKENKGVHTLSVF